MAIKNTPIENENGRGTLNGYQILSVEDNEDIQALNSQILRSLGAQVAFAYDGKEAIHQAIKGSFDLILIDINLPVMNGLQATRILRRFKCTTPIVCVTASAEAQKQEIWKNAGAQNCLLKPFRTKDLTEIIFQLCTKC